MFAETRMHPARCTRGRHKSVTKPSFSVTRDRMYLSSPRPSTPRPRTQIAAPYASWRVQQSRSGRKRSTWRGMGGTPDRETSWFMSTPYGVEVVLARYECWTVACLARCHTKSGPDLSSQHQRQPAWPVSCPQRVTSSHDMPCRQTSGSQTLLRRGELCR